MTLVGLAAVLARPAMAASTLETVQAAGTLRCGVVATPEDWNKSDLHGDLSPLGVEVCKAVSVAALGAKAHLTVKPYRSELEAEDGLAHDEVDAIAGVTPTATAMSRTHIRFSTPYFYDAQGILVRQDLPVNSVQDLRGVAVCVIEGTDNEKLLLSHTVARGIAINPMPFQEEGEMDDGMAVRHCDAVSAYLSRLAQMQTAYPKQFGGDRVLPDRLSLSPVSMAYRPDDLQWGMIVDWTIHCLVQAEANGITQANLGKSASSEDVVVQRVLGIDWATSQALGLPARNWSAQVISVVGNYGEIYDRTVGEHGHLRLPRGLNALWTQGGLMHPWPME